MATGAEGTFHRPGHAWVGAHLFHRGKIYDEASDRVVLEVVRPFVETCRARGWIEGFFFIRYGELGPHVRLRLYGDPRVLAEEVAPALEAHVRETLPPELAAAPREEPAEVTFPSAVPSLRWIPYEPEVERYGGPRAIRVAEQLFRCSSETSIELLGLSPVADRAVRLGRALPAMTVLLAAFTDDPAEAASLALLHRNSFAGHPTRGGVPDYREKFDGGYDRQADVLGERIHSFWTAVQEGVALPPPLDAYHDGIRAARAQLDELTEAGLLLHQDRPVASRDEARRALLPSYGHMTSNRLGVTPYEEGYLMHMIDRTLGGADARPD